MTCLIGSALLSTGLVGPASASSAPPVFVTVHLASDAQAVAKLAHATALPRTERLTRLRAAVATRASRLGVSSYLAGHGFRVVQSSPFVVRAQASAADVATTFAPSSTGGLHVPPALADEASYVVSSDELAGKIKPFMTAPTFTGGDFRELYDAPSGQPPAGHVSPTIATLQFSGWDSGDLTQYAADNGLADPVASGRYSAVSVDGADPKTLDGSGGEIEVALDQESLLATAPYAKQVAYFAPNSGGSMIDAIEQVATDAYNGQNIGALSISYGLCETDVPLDYLAALHQSILDAVAAGITIFTASGDEGAYACGPGNVSVNSPADDPLVTAVGGTTTGGTPSGPMLDVWWDGTNGSGGGTSTVYDEPSYQQKQSPGLPGRGVPDISLDADPQSGFDIDVDGLTGTIGGTSLASPLAAATLIDMLSSNGTDYGIGLINPNLYSAPATGFRDVTGGGNGVYSAAAGYDLASGLGSPRWTALQPALIGSPTMHAPALSQSRTIHVSVTAPTGMVYSGWRIGTGTPPASCGKQATTTKPTSVTAPSDGTARIYVIGYTLSGYCYLGHAKTVVDSVAPKATATARVTNTSQRSLRFSWHATDHSPSSGITGFRVTVAKVGSSKPVFKTSQTTKESFALSKAARGATYVVKVSAVDAAGNRSKVATAQLTT